MPSFTILLESISPMLFWALFCHAEPFAVILSEAKNLALSAHDKLREEFCFLLSFQSKKQTLRGV